MTRPRHTASYTVSLAGTLQAGETATIILSLTDGTTSADGSDYAKPSDARSSTAVAAYNGADPGSLSYAA